MTSARSSFGTQRPACFLRESVGPPVRTTLDQLDHVPAKARADPRGGRGLLEPLRLSIRPIEASRIMAYPAQLSEGDSKHVRGF